LVISEFSGKVFIDDKRKMIREIMGYKRYVVLRSINSLIVILAVVAITFLLFDVVFANQVITQTRQEVSAAITQGCRHGGCDPNLISKWIEGNTTARIHALGLDAPLLDRLVSFTWRVFTFNFGTSWYQEGDTNDIMTLILQRLPNTLLLFGTATIVTILIGVFLGVRVAIKPGSLMDKSVIVSGLVGWSFAAWWVGMFLIYVFGYLLKYYTGFGFPTGGTTSQPAPRDPFLYVVDVLWHLILPVSALVLVSYGGWALQTRNLLINIFTEDYIVTAKAKGLPDRRVLYGHALKNAAPPIITLVALALASVFGGAIITEAVFNWNGMGTLYWYAILNGDIPVVMALFYISTILLVLANFIADLLYGIFDPRVKVG
jgi:peptide/nickel transport system permease protein